MSMAKCKFDKIFDTDEEMNEDTKGNSCCDDCYEEELEKFTEDLKSHTFHNCEIHMDQRNGFINTINFDCIAQELMDKGWRKVK